jgi:hypothetical protein
MPATEKKVVIVGNYEKPAKPLQILESYVMRIQSNNSFQINEDLALRNLYKIERYKYDVSYDRARGYTMSKKGVRALLSTSMPLKDTEFIISLKQVGKTFAGKTDAEGRIMSGGELQQEIEDYLDEVKNDVFIAVNRQIESLYEAEITFEIPFTGGIKLDLDMTRIAFFNEKITAYQNQITAYQNQMTELQSMLGKISSENISTPATYEAFAKEVTALKPYAQYPSLLNLLRDNITKVGNNIIRKKQAERESISGTIPKFVITGDITDSSDLGANVIYQIWGTAIPTTYTNAATHSDGFRQQESNLHVTVNKKIPIDFRHGTNIIIYGYYLNRDYGTSVSGQRVPIFNYTNDISQIPGYAAMKRQLDPIDAEIAELKNIYERFSTELE